MKASELTGAALDWAVAKCEGVVIHWDKDEEVYAYHDREEDGERPWSPSTDWAQGGPIIEREGVAVVPDAVQGWSAYVHANLFKEDGTEAHRLGPTPLIAAMRCYVASKLGDDIDIPKELQ